MTEEDNWKNKMKKVFLIMKKKKKLKKENKDKSFFICYKLKLIQENYYL